MQTLRRSNLGCKHLLGWCHPEGKQSSGDERRAKNSKSDLFADSIIGELSGVFVRALFIVFFWYGRLLLNVYCTSLIIRMLTIPPSVFDRTWSEDTWWWLSQACSQTLGPPWTLSSCLDDHDDDHDENHTHKEICFGEGWSKKKVSIQQVFW